MHDIIPPTLDQNGLLAALSAADRALVTTVARIVRLHSGATLYEPGDLVGAAYLPLRGAVASFHVVMEDGSVIETAMIGREGAIGGIVSRGRFPAYARSKVMHGGHFARIDSAALEMLTASSPAIRDLFSRYADCLLAQVFQSVACNAVHDLDQRAAKWLTAAIDRTGTNHVAMTQEQFGSLLGIARSYASRLIQRFKAEGLLQTRRGGLVVTDTAGMHRRACGCNDLIKAHFNLMLESVYPESGKDQGQAR